MDHTYDVELDQCCMIALEEIRDKKELGRVLAGALGVSPLAAIANDDPVESKFSVSTHDWDAWSRAVQSVPPAERNRCHQIATLHALDHSNGPKGDFWREMVESFEGRGR